MSTSESHTTDQPIARRIPVVLIAMGMFVPTLITFVYFDLLEDRASWMQKSAYAIGKLTQFAVLICAIWFWYRRRAPQRTTLNSQPSTRNPKYTAASPSRRWLWFGVLSGVTIALAMLAAFHWILNPYGVMEPAKATAQEKLATLGADSPIVLLAIALFYSIFHSGLEELYWRGFVFRGLREYIAVNPAIVLSSLGFMSHHVIVLAKFFGYDSVVTYLFSLGVAMGGAIWAYTYHRAQSLVPGWISHAFVDAAIFGIGYLMIFAR